MAFSVDVEIPLVKVYPMISDSLNAKVMSLFFVTFTW